MGGVIIREYCNVIMTTENGNFKSKQNQSFIENATFFLANIKRILFCEKQFINNL